MNCAKEDKKHTKNQVDVHKCTKLPERYLNGCVF